MTSDRLSGLDIAFLSLERERTPLQLGALAVFRSDRPVSAGRVAALLAERVCRTPRLHRTLRRSWFPPAAHWFDDPEFDPHHHVVSHRLDDPAPEAFPAAAAQLAASLLGTPLPRDRPLWQVHVIAGADRHRFAVVAKLHHAFADGLGALRIGLGLLDGADGVLAGGGSRAARGPGARAEPADASAGTRGTRRLVADTVGQASEAFGIARSVLGSVRLPAPSSPLVVDSSGPRALGLARVDLGRVRRIRSRHGGTANDVMLAVLSGALRDWMGERGHRVDGLTLRALIPVSRRARAGDRATGNQMSGYLCGLPVGEPDPVARLRQVRLNMQRCKAGGTRRGPGAVPLLADLVPAAVHVVAGPAAGQAAVLLFDLLVTSVPLPGGGLRLGGADLEEIFPVAPLAPTHALCVAMSSYRGTMYVGFHVDRDAMPDVSGLAAAMGAAVDALETA